MTPGNAKKRDELPWLPYRTSDKVIINAHNFEPPVAAFSPAVNGKMPIAAWIPSRTQSADDLVGTNNGTLTNGASIVADTGAGGTDAFNFDGINDEVTMSANSLASQTTALVSCWVYLRASYSFAGIAGSWSASISNRSFVFLINAGLWSFGTGNGASQSLATSGTPAINTWTHLAGIRNATSTILYVNGTQVAINTSHSGTITAGAGVMRLGNLRVDDASRFFTNMLLDDWRIFAGDTYDATDIADLYAAGLGRGIDAS